MHLGITMRDMEAKHCAVRRKEFRNFFDCYTLCQAVKLGRARTDPTPQQPVTELRARLVPLSPEDQAGMLGTLAVTRGRL